MLGKTAKYMDEMGFTITPKDMNNAIHEAQKKINIFYKDCDNNAVKDTVIRSANDAISALIAMTNTQSDYCNQLATLNSKLSKELRMMNKTSSL